MKFKDIKPGDLVRIGRETFPVVRVTAHWLFISHDKHWGYGYSRETGEGAWNAPQQGIAEPVAREMGEQ